MSKDPKYLSQQRYTQFAKGYVESSTHAGGEDLDRLVQLARFQEDWIGLDIATGGGHTARRFALSVRRIVAIDLTLPMLQAARQSLQDKGVDNVDFTTAEAEILPFSEACFDFATCRIAAHHFPSVEHFIRETWRMLKTGGVFLFQDHVLPEDQSLGEQIDNFERARDPSHNRAFSRSTWEDYFLKAGFTIETVEILQKRHNFQDWAKRQGCSPETIAQLEKMVSGFPPAVRDWLEPEHFGAPDASFVNRHILLTARK